MSGITHVQAAPPRPEIKVLRTGRKPAPWCWRIVFGPTSERTSARNYGTAEEAFEAARAYLDRPATPRFPGMASSGS